MAPLFSQATFGSSSFGRKMALLGLGYTGTAAPGEAGDSVQEALPGVLLRAQNFKGTTGHYLSCFLSWYLSTLRCMTTFRTRILEALDLGLLTHWPSGLGVPLTGRVTCTSHPLSPRHPCTLHPANMAAVTLVYASPPLQSAGRAHW